VVDKLFAGAREVGGGMCGWDALELCRIEAGIPRFGRDMDETNLPPEAGLDSRAISYTKGCYIGQEVLARIRTYGQVAKALRGLKFLDSSEAIPVKGDKLFFNGKEAGYITSAAVSPRAGGVIALGYVRRECNVFGSELVLPSESGARRVRVVELPFTQAK
jgi:folate-binding protein YgfZ